MLNKKALAATAGGVAAAGEAVFTDTSGAISWTVPTGVTSISAVCIGAGGAGSVSTSGGMGGGGGDLRYYNNLSVTPGETLTITVGAGSTNTSSASGTAGGFSRIARSGTTLLEAAGGGGGSASGSGAKNGTSTTIGGSVGGGDGGTCGDGGSADSGGGGGAGGYSGNGGNGAFGANAGSAGSGGAAGGGGGRNASLLIAGYGGGVNVFGEFFSGLGGDASDCGNGGSYGDGGIATGVIGSNLAANQQVFFGSGSSGADNSTGSTTSGQGAVRIVWPGTTRSFPSTDVWMSQVITTVIETQSGGGTITIPASAAAGDLAVLILGYDASTSPVTPSGWTLIVSQSANSPTLAVWYRILQSGDPGTSVTLTTGSKDGAEMYVFRKATGSISSVSISGGTIADSASIIASQTQNASTATAPFIVFGAIYGSEQANTADMYFTGGLAGSGKTEPSATYSKENGGSSSGQFMRFRIYDTAPANNVVVVNARDLGRQTMGSFIIEVN